MNTTMTSTIRRKGSEASLPWPSSTALPSIPASVGMVPKRASLPTAGALVVAMASSSFRNPHNLPTKVCVTCQQRFTWRKKWESSWDDITTCSKRCNSERKREQRAANRPVRLGLTPLSDAKAEDGDTSDAEGPEDPKVRKAARKAERKGLKAERRAKREGRADATVGQKPCGVCGTGVDLLVRCQLGPSETWSMVCGRCWRKPEVAGGVVDGCRFG